MSVVEKEHKAEGTLARWIQRLVGSWMFTPLAIAFVLSLVFAAFGFRMQKRESQELHAVFDQHLRLVTRVIEVAAEHALRDGQNEGLHRMIVSAQNYDNELHVLVADANGQVLFTTHDAYTNDPDIRAWIDETLRTKARLTRQLGHGMDRVQVTTAVLDDATMPDSVLVVSKSMRVLEEDLRDTRAHAVGVTVVMALFTLFFGLILAHQRVRGPLIRLRDVMNTLEDVEGKGIASPPTRSYGMSVDNEVRALSHAFSELIDRLAAARRSVDVLHAQREALVERLVESTGRAKLLQFSSELAHEIGSPLQVLLGRAMMLQDRAEDPEQVRRHARIIVDETTRIQRIVERSLNETTEENIEPRWVRIADRARDIAHLNRERTGDRRVPYHFDFEDPSIVVYVDEDALDQILRNLLSNAHEACAQRGAITLRLRRVDHEVELVIHDTGVGMDDTTLKQALQPFFSTRTHAIGHGFGLPIVQRLCRDLGIVFAIRSRAGEGTTVTLCFPQVPFSDTPPTS